MSCENEAVFNGEFHTCLSGDFTIPRKLPEACDERAAADKAHGSPLAALPRPELASLASIVLSGPPPPPPPLPAAGAAVRETSNSPAPVTASRKRTMGSHDGLPAELLKLIQPLCCELCSAKLNSPISAKMHYESKNHEKKIAAWLSQWSARTGEPMPKRPATKCGPTGPNALHCDVCDIPLTSLQHANQHYMGKKHRQVLAGRAKPSGSGYYDSNNKWVRVDTKLRADDTNRFHIGTAFLQAPRKIDDEPQPEEPLEMPPTPNINNLYDDEDPEEPQRVDATQESESQSNGSAPAGVSVPLDLEPRPEQPLVAPSVPNAELAKLETRSAPAKVLSKHCEICDVSVTSEVHMQLHLNGAKHAKKLRQLGAPPFTKATDTLSQCFMPNYEQPQPKKAGKGIDYSVYRTPSGQYYCLVCNITVTSEVLLDQHFGSKKHLRTASSAKKK